MADECSWCYIYLCDVELGEEPAVVGRPINHLRVTREQRLLRKLRLQALHLRERERERDRERETETETEREGRERETERERELLL